MAAPYREQPSVNNPPGGFATKNPPAGYIAKPISFISFIPLCDKKVEMVSLSNESF
jgi:hypothetical protein